METSDAVNGRWSDCSAAATRSGTANGLLPRPATERTATAVTGTAVFVGSRAVGSADCHRGASTVGGPVVGPGPRPAGSGHRAPACSTSRVLGSSVARRAGSGLMVVRGRRVRGCTVGLESTPPSRRAVRRLLDLAPATPSVRPFLRRCGDVVEASHTVARLLRACRSTEEAPDPECEGQ
jgi:hypothetical protein